jgi:hypothetical protein
MQTVDSDESAYLDIKNGSSTYLHHYTRYHLNTLVSQPHGHSQVLKPNVVPAMSSRPASHPHLNWDLMSKL